MKLYTWRCPECEDGQPGQYRPRPDNPCRVCPSCSLRFGRVVRRFRDGPYGKAARRAAPKPITTWAGVDLHAELARLWALEIVGHRVQRPAPRLTLTVRPKRPTRSLAYACFERREIEIFVWKGLKSAEALATLVHEVAHIVVGKEAAHGEEWRMMLVELVREGYGVEPEFPSYDPHSIGALDYSVELALGTWLRRNRRG